MKTMSTVGKVILKNRKTIMALFLTMAVWGFCSFLFLCLMDSSFAETVELILVGRERYLAVSTIVFGMLFGYAVIAKAGSEMGSALATQCMEDALAKAGL